ncbi:MAG TPA: carbohydrate binding domain-containing protein, partial [Verrucomicrobiae bacterium]|nr:carbohydrate binding domain-containing protein [Verrucomicrobiae bacterium]
MTDFSSLNTPISTNRVLVDTNAHFVVNGQRIRFLGVNFAWDSPSFTPTNYADSVAGRLAKFGVNCVRLHQMDAINAYGGGLISYYTLGSSTNFNSTNLDRLHYLVSRLKAHGIYSDVNLLVGHEYLAGDGLGPEVTNMNYLDSHVLGFFYAPALALQEDYATKLLSPTNGYTGLPLAKDPAVAFVEIVNENGLFLKWHEGVLDSMPARYTTNLQAQWNDWLVAHYTNDATMLTAWGLATNQPLGTNLVVNGDFSNGLTGWGTEQHGNAIATFSVTHDFTNGQPSAKVVVSTADTVSWYVQLNRAGMSLSSNQIYTVSFWAKSSPATNASAGVQQAHDSYSLLGYYQGLNLTTNWQFFSNTFQPSASDTNARINFGSMGNEVGTFWYAAVQVQSGGQALPVGTSLAARNVPNIAFQATGGYTGNQAAQLDWASFLRSLESNYYNTMVGYIRTNIGYQGLIIGTIVSESPATVQSQLDVIDSHDYWADPRFPGTPWDPVNWSVTNISMVNTIGDDNTLANIARMRIKGKPFTVTEYEHSSPNYYGGEGPLMLAAYAGLQDWDGIWLFDYGYGDPVTTLGYVQDYFSIGQHPTKLSNLLLAANLFRRYDVKPAMNEITMAMTPDTELGLLINKSANNIFSSSYLGVSASLAFTNRIDTSVGTNASGLLTAPPGPSGNVVSSDTGELRWDVSQAGNGILTADTSRTKFLVGYADNKAVSLSGITFKPGTTRLGWCTLGMTVTQGSVLTNNCTALIVATGWWENTNQVWTDTNKDSVGTNWGGPPVLTEVVPFSVTLPVPTNYVHAWSLDESGQLKAALSVTGNALSSTITVSTNANSVWYEVQIDPWGSTSNAYISGYQPTDGQTGVLATNPVVATILNQVTEVNTNTMRLIINGVDVT